LPPKVTLPEELEKRSVVCNYSLATQQVTEEILRGYFKFCGSISCLEVDAPYGMISFEHDFQGDTAVFLDQGNVCGGPIQVFRYRDFNSKVVQPDRKKVEKLASKFITSNEKRGRSPVEEKVPEKVEVNISKEAENTSTKIYVTNLSEKADAPILMDFFSYCGIVSDVVVYSTFCAKVEFEESESATTALLLSNAYIYDKPIEITTLTPDLEKKLTSLKVATELHEKSTRNTGGAKSKTSVIASLTASGYNVGKSAVSKARTFDEKYVGLGATTARAKDSLLKFDEKHLGLGRTKDQVMKWFK